MAFLNTIAEAPVLPQPVNGAAMASPLALDVNGIGGSPLSAVPAVQQPRIEISDHHQQLLDWSDQIKTPNIAELLTEEQRNTIGDKVVREYEIDDRSRSEWLEKSKTALDLAMQYSVAKSYPWPKASNLIYPLMTSAAISFAARAYPAVVAGRNVVKGIAYGDDDGIPEMAPDGSPAVAPSQQGAPGAIPGPDGQFYAIKWKQKPGAKRERADRVGEHMSYQLLEENPDWDADTDELLHVLPIVGCHFRKTYFDPIEGQNVSTLVSARKLVINYWAKSLNRAPRVTEEFELYPHEISENVAAGIYIEHKYGPTQKSAEDKDAPHEFLEQHRLLDLDDDGYPEPYVVTVHKLTRKVARIVARYDAEGIKVSKTDNAKIVKIDKVQYYTQFNFMPNMEGGIYGMGFGQLLQPINASINTTLNMLIDAGHLQNTGGGFVGKGVSMHSGSLKFAPGEWKVVNTPGAAIRDAMVPLDFKGPSPVLFSLLGMLIEAGKEISASNDVLEGNTNMATMQPTTMLALIEQGLKVFTAIYKRIHRSLKQEFEKLARLNRLYLEEQTKYRVGDIWKEISREDYLQGAGVCPWSDPQMVSDLQRLGKAQFLLSFKDDSIIDQIEIRRRALEAGQIADIDKLIVKQEAPPPSPEVMALMAATQSKIATERSAQTKNYAQAVLYLAQADEKEADGDMNWIHTQLAVIQQRMEANNGRAAPAQIAPPAGDAGAAGETPPVEGARKAKDGLWYAPDVDRPGKYLQVQ